MYKNAEEINDRDDGALALPQCRWKPVFRPAWWMGFLFVAVLNAPAQILLEATGGTNTYELIESVLGPGSASETPDCSHPEFGPHITQSWDDQLGKYVFSFFIHVTPDNDRCIYFDRQRNEIKTYGPSPDYLQGFYGDTTTYRWYFKLDDGFQPSPNFTHIHQIKAGDGSDADMPLITITPRYASPERLEIIYTAPTAFGGASSTLATANLSGFKGQWIEANETMLNAANGTYALELKRVSDGAILLSCSSSSLNMWRADATFNRPKWGIYRSLNSPSYLRDEEVRFADFCFAKNGDTCPNLPPSIELDPTSVTVLAGQPATFTASAIGTPPLSYKWFFNTTNPLAGGIKATLALADVQGEDVGEYSVVVTNAYGSVTSSVATLTLSAGNTVAFTTAGTHTWICPDSITSVQVECWGGGGAGGSAWRDPNSGSTEYGGGGAGGAYARFNSYPVVPGNTYYVHVGEGGQNSSTTNDTTLSGGESWFNALNQPSSIIVAKGGAGGESAVGNTSDTRYGVGGTGTSGGSAGNVVHAGGSGATGALSMAGGGGSSAGSGSDGNNASSNIGATAPMGGGDGGTGPTTSSGSGGSGYAPGGGGSGARSGNGVVYAGGNGGTGKVVLTFAIGGPASNVTAAAAMPTGDGSGPGGLTTYAQRTLITLAETPTAGTAPFTYAWKKVGSGTVLGTNSNLVVFSPVDGDQYVCEVATVWDGVTNTSPPATLTVTSAIDPAKVAIIKADDFRGPNQAWTDFINASGNLGVKVGIGVIVTSIVDQVPTAAWMQVQEAAGEVEFWNHGWDHSRWTNEVVVTEFEGSGLAFMQEHMALAQSGLTSALGHEVLAFGTPYNGFDADTAAVINETPALRLLFTRDIALAESLLDSAICVDIIGEADGTGLPNAATFKATYPGGPTGPVSLQFHPPVTAWTASNSLAQYVEIVEFLLSQGYAVLTPSEYLATRPITANFTASPVSGGAPLEVTFTDLSSGLPTNRFWDFGDGETANTSGMTVQHTYRMPGTNTITLIAAGDSGSSTHVQTDLVVVASVDTVGDGIPDWWRALYFGGDGSATDAVSTATADVDLDGRNNLAEYSAATDPTNSASRFALVDFEPASMNTTLAWIGGIDAWQLVERRDSLTDTNGWNAIFTNMPPTPVTNILLDSGIGADSCRFYRIKAWR